MKRKSYGGEDDTSENSILSFFIIFLFFFWRRRFYRQYMICFWQRWFRHLTSYRPSGSSPVGAVPAQRHPMTHCSLATLSFISPTLHSSLHPRFSLPFIHALPFLCSSLPNIFRHVMSFSPYLHTSYYNIPRLIYFVFFHTTTFSSSLRFLHLHAIQSLCICYITISYSLAHVSVLLTP